MCILLEHKMSVDIDPGGFPYSAKHIQFLTHSISFKACCNRAYLGSLERENDYCKCSKNTL